MIYLISLKISPERKKIYKEIILIFRFNPMEGWQSRELKNHLCFQFLWQKPSLTYLLKGAFVLHPDHGVAFSTDTALLLCLLFQLSAHLTLYRKRNNRLKQSFILNSEEVTFKCFEDMSAVTRIMKSWTENSKWLCSKDSYLKFKSMYFHNKRKKKKEEKAPEKYIFEREWHFAI